MLTLAVTSSTSIVGVAVGRLGASPAEVTADEVVTDRRHAEELTPLLARTVAKAGAAFSDVERFVVDVGPGRFTGLRVGLATVRTLALATNTPVIGITSLEILAWAEPSRPLVAVIDARRAEVFQQRFDHGMTATGPATVGRPDDLAAAAVGATVVGDGADRYAELYGSGLLVGRAPSAADMIGAAAGRPARPGREIAPCYLRDPDVQINVKTRPVTG